MKYVAFLHGINQGRHNRIEMSELVRILEARGLKNIKTYRQNGNVVFDSDLDAVTLKRMIEREIFIVYYYVVPVIVMEVTELKNVIDNCPFSHEEIKKARKQTGEPLYIILLNKPLTEDKQTLLRQLGEYDYYQYLDRAIYLLFFDRLIRSSILVHNITQIDVYAVVRDVDTLKKLIQLSE
ncbi:MAG: DUF1697 domain-containing protein [Bacilli bacterium]|nr:DUF1697 domain-containing protein [Bacilli bacterium]